GSSSSRFAALFVLSGLSMASSIAAAEVVLHDGDGWRFFSTGRAEGHYQLIQGDGDPHNLNNKLVGGQIQNSSQDQNNKLSDSRIRSGFVGTQIGFGVSTNLSETLEAKAFIGLWLNGIDSHKGNPPYGKSIDAREGWGSLTGPLGTILFGRTFSVFGSASGEVNAYAYEFAVGNPCLAEAETIACGSVGAGPIYAAPNAQFRYISPRLAGLQLQLALADPSSTPDYQITNYPRVEGEIGYQLQLGENGKVIVKGQGFTQQLAKVNGTQNGTISTTAWGGMGVARLEVAGLRVGGGAWTAKGGGTHTILQQDDPGKPLAHDLPGGMDPMTGLPLPGDNLRMFKGFFGNLAYRFRGTALAVGGGTVSIQETLSDALTPSTSLLRQNLEFHVVLTQRIHNAIVLSAEFMHWKSEWYRGESQILNFIGGGSTFVW
ncbi:MAG TPA: porin, partial [Polyangia bacterium]|nr:porin [Polyangia bacterium]